MSGKLCMGCMNPVSSDSKQCETCGYDGKQQNPGSSLPIGYRINERYAVGKVLDTDGDSVSYIGYDLIEGKKVVVREYLPLNGCVRAADQSLEANSGADLHYKNSLMDFTDLFTNLKKITDQPGMIQVLDLIKQNNTAYVVLEYFDAITLREFVALKNTTLTIEQCLLLFDPVIKALEAIHGVNLIHRGVSPETIFLNRSGAIKIGGYATTSVRTKGTEVKSKLFSGFSAPEQYATTTWQSVATDVYSLAATIYRCLTGATPQDAEQRITLDNLLPAAEVNDDIEPYVSAAIEKAMLIDPAERVQSVFVLKKMLEDDYVEDGAEIQETAKPKDKKEKLSDEQKHSRYKFAMIAAMVMLGISLVGAALRLFVFPPADDGDAGYTPSVLTVPDYTGMSIEDAQKEFDVYTFKYQIQAEYNSSLALDEVVRQSPVQNTTVEEGTVITIYVNKAVVVEMVDLTGLTQENALLKLKELSGLEPSSMKVEFEDYTTSNGYPGTVVEQSVEQGEEFNFAEDTLELTIARKPAS